MTLNRKRLHRRRCALPQPLHNAVANVGFIAEQLESRTMLAADLGVLLSTSKAPKVLVPQDHIVASVKITDFGPKSAAGAVRVSMYLSSDAKLDPSDKLLASKSSVPIKLSTHHSAAAVMEAIAIPATQTPGTYYLIAKIIAAPTIGDHNSSNDTAVAGPLQVADEFGSFAGRSKVALTVNDADRTAVTFSLSGAGYGQVEASPGGLRVLLHGTNANSSLTVTSKGGNGKSDLSVIDADSRLKSIDAKTASLHGDLFVNGPIGAITLGAARSSSHFIATAFPKSVTIGKSQVKPATDRRFITKAMAPQVVAALSDDTGSSSVDAITNDPAVTARVELSAGVIEEVKVGIDEQPASQFVSVLGEVLAGGSLNFSRAREEQILGRPLSDGTHVLHLVAKGNARTTSQDVHYTLDTGLFPAPSFDLDNASDSAPVGDGQTTLSIVTLLGSAEPGATATLTQTGATVVAGTDGIFTFTDVPLAPGANVFTVSAIDAAGNSASSTRTITRVPAGAAQSSAIQVALDWNTQTLNAIAADASAPPVAARALAMSQAAQYDAVNSVTGGGSPLYAKVSAAPGASADAAAAQAAHDVLSYLYPAQASTFDAQLSTSLAGVTDTGALASGVSVGQQVAAVIIAQRANDGATGFVNYQAGSGAGVWQPTYPMYAPALDPQYATLKPFLMTSDSQFRPAGPSALTSQTWVDDYNQIESLGEANSTTRTSDQTQIAKFWADGSGTITPAGHWNLIATQLLESQNGVSLIDATRLLAQLNVAMGDAAIVAWDAKYDFNFWRPITAIQAGGGNSQLTADGSWQPLLVTPPFPEYVSGHSAFSAAAAVVLGNYFGANTSFTTGSPSPGMSGVTRTYANFEAAANEAGLSRIYGGIHFNTSVQDGLVAGKELGQYVLQAFPGKPAVTDTLAPRIIISTAAGGAVKTNFSINGNVVDDTSGVASLQVAVDGGAFASASFDAAGNFVYTTALATDGSAEGSHVLHFRATDAAGNMSQNTDFAFTVNTAAPTISLESPAASALLSAGATISGTASGNGSAITSLSYSFDNGTAMPVAFDPADGSFSDTLDLSRLSAGAHSLNVVAMNAAGNVVTSSVNVSLPSAIPLAITQETPTPGDGDVGVTYRPEIFFSRPIDTTTLNSTNFFASDTAGNVLPATIVPANDGTFALLFFNSAMPGASTITLTVNGATIKTADGSALDALGNGTPGSQLQYSFTTVSTTGIDGTTLSGTLADPGPDLRSGTPDDVAAGADNVLQTADDIYKLPIAGATISIAGTNLTTRTGSNGKFSFSSVPSGDVKLIIDGTTASNAPSGFYFPEMTMDLNIQAGQANTVMAAMQRSGTSGMPASGVAAISTGVYIARLRTSLKTTVTTAGAHIAVAAPNAPDLTAQQQKFLTVDVPANALIGNNGQPMSSAQIGISTVPPELIMDMLPPGLMQLSNTITVQAPGVAAFATPLPLTFPNVYGAAPGTKLPFYSFNHQTGRLEIVGTGTVSADGQSVSTDPGTGVPHPGWFGFTPPGDDVEGQILQDCLKMAGPEPSAVAANVKYFKDGAILIATILAPEFAIPLTGLSGAINLFLSRHEEEDKRLNELGDAITDINRDGTAELLGEHAKDLGEIAEKANYVATGVGFFNDLSEIRKAHDEVDEYQEYLEDCIEMTRDIREQQKINSELADIDGELMDLKNSLTSLDSDLQQALQSETDYANFLDDFSKQLDELFARPGGGSALDYSNTADRAVIDSRLLSTDPANPDNPATTPGDDTLIVPQPSGDPAGTSIGVIIENRQDDGASVYVIPAPAARSADVGDTLATARPLSVPLDGGVSVDQTVGDNAAAANDVDLYSFTANAGDVITAIASRQSTGLSMALRLFDSGGHQIGSDTDSGLNANPRLQYITLPAGGTYYLGVSSYQNTQYNPASVAGRSGGASTGDYRLTIERMHAMPTFHARLYQTTIDAVQANQPLADDTVRNLLLSANSLISGATSEFDNLMSVSFSPVLGKQNLAFRDVSTGAITRATTGASGSFSVQLAAQRQYELVVYSPQINSTAIIPFTTGQSGGTQVISDILLGDQASVDSDGDGLTDDGETAVGTDPHKFDTNGDGLSDLADIQQGLDPLSGVGLPTGIVASATFSGVAESVAVGSAQNGATQSTAYVAESTGLAIVDVSQADKPVIRSQLSLSGGSATDVAVDSSLQIAAVADNAGGLVLVNVANTSNPIITKTIAANATHVRIRNGIAYLADGDDLKSYDLATGEFLQTFKGSNSITGMAFNGPTLYTMDDQGILTAIDTAGAQMTLLGELAVPDHQVNNLYAGGGGPIFAGGNYVYTAGEGYRSGVSGYGVIDVSDPTNMKVVSFFDGFQGGPTGIAGLDIAVNSSGRAITVGSPGGLPSQLDVLDSTDPTIANNFITQFNLPADPVSLTLAGGIAYVADGSGGLQIVNYAGFDNQGKPPTVSANLSSLDSDSNTPGIQAVASSTIIVDPSATDDAQVRAVQLLINGQVVAQDLSYPYELASALPAISVSGTSATLQIRAIDTGGNVSLTPLTTITLVPDTTPPTLLRTDPPDGAIRSVSLRTITLTFSEALASAGITPSAFTLTGPSGAITLSGVALDAVGRNVTLSLPVLTPGQYTLSIDGTKVTDLAGNALSSGALTRSFTIGVFSDIWIARPGNNDDFADPANWSAGRVPNSSDDVFIDESNNNILHGSGTFSIHTMVVVGDFSILGGTLILGGGDSFVSGDFDQSGGTLAGAGNLTVDGTYTWAGGSMSGTGRTIIAAGGTLNIVSPGFGSTVTLARTLENDGSANWTANQITFANGVINNAGVWTTNGSSAILTATDAISTTENNAFNNTGTYTQNGDGAARFRKSFSTASGVLFNNSGSVMVKSGELQLSTGGTHTGGFSISSGAQVTLDGAQSFSASSTITGAGTFLVDGGSTTLDGSRVIPGIFSIDSGTATFSASTTIASMTLSSDGTFAGSGNVSFTGTLTWTGGDMSGTGTTLIASGAKLNISTPGFGSTVTLARTLENDGAATWTANQFTFANGEVNNKGTWSTTSGAAILTAADDNSNTDVNAFNNFGTYNQTGTGGARFRYTFGGSSGVQFNNLASAAVNVLAGSVLELQCGGTSGGTFATAGTLQLAGTHTFTNRSAFTGAGVVSVAGGTSSFNSSAGYAIAGTLQVNDDVANNSVASFAVNSTLAALSLEFGGTVAGAGNLTLTGVSTWNGGMMSGGGKTIIAGGGTLNIASPGFGSTVTLERTLQNSGTVNWTADQITFANGTINNLATWNTNGGATQLNGVDNISSTDSNAFNNSGTYNQTGSGGMRFRDSFGGASGVQFNNTAAVNIATGSSMILASGGNSSGTFAIATGAAIELGDTHTFTTGSSFSGPGTLHVAGGSSNFNSPAGYTIPGILLVDDALSTSTASFVANSTIATISLSFGGTLTGTANLTASAMTWTGGTMSGAGTTVIPAGRTLNISSPGFGSTVSLGRILEIDGTANWTADQITFINGAVNNKGTWNTTGGTSLLTATDNVSSTDTNAFNNFGIYSQSGSGARFRTSFNGASGVQFNNQPGAAVNVSSGTLTLNTIGTNHGTLKISAGAKIAATNTFNNAPDGTVEFVVSSGSQYGVLALAGGSFAGTLKIDNSFSPSVGTLFPLITMTGARTGTFQQLVGDPGNGNQFVAQYSSAGVAVVVQ